ncbi:hypothetical protein CAC42_720 [Sphaceloma murrayae]|uniref:Uncharacterized protein n=1 Tax=Sphaceloma murrayae TaxID=2082308 RepID=A0A2K1QKI9_9PEZI|nr:hypothetical protein CAC42_720 [Sphaceloma murrayae]
MAARESDKGSRYIDQLNIARLNGAWSEVQEVLRKVNKHAPSRQCKSSLILTATTEHELTPNALARHVPSSNTEDSTYADVGSKLSQAIDSEKVHAEDAFAARVCLAHAQWAQGQWTSILQTLSREHWNLTPNVSSPITLYSAIKGKYILGCAHQQLETKAEAEHVFESAISLINSARESVMEYPEIHRWASRVLGELCAMTTAEEERGSLSSMNKMLVRLRSWSSIGRDAPREVSPEQSPTRLWKAYHTLLANILRSNLVYTGSETQPLAVSSRNIPKFTLSAQRNKQIVELGRVARACEQALMTETKFPKATGNNETFELFADEVVQCWRIMVGPEWTDADIGERGKVGCTRNILEFLYRAAARTFHSTPILRHLITVHATLAEFDLAIKALDSYIEIISKGKARAEKTGAHELGLDNDDIVLYTVSEAIKLLCLYGESDEAEKAFELGQKTAAWLQQVRPKSSASIAKDLDPSSATERVAAEQFSTSSALAAAYKGIGQSKATWARFTPDHKQRDDLQDEAIRDLGRALHLSSQSGPDLEIAYLLAYSQAERRSVADGIDTIKTVIAQDTRTPAGIISWNQAEVEFEAQRRRLPIMHLLVLLLSASSQFDAAIMVCESTIEDMLEAARACDGSSGLYLNGDSELHKTGDLPPYLLRNLQDTERECLLQIKITEMELLTLLENISYAGSKRQELLKMYEQLFGNPRPQSAATTVGQNTVSSTLPKSRAGTVKSFRESIFGRPKSSRKSLDKSTFDPPPPVPNHPLLAKTTDNTETQPQPDPPILLKVTNEDGEPIEDEPKSKLSRMSASIRRGRQRHSHDISKLQSENHEDAAKRSASDPPPVQLLNGTTTSRSNRVKSTSRSRVSSRGSEVVAVPAPGNDEADGHVNDIQEKDESLAAPAPALRTLTVDETCRRNPPPMFSKHQCKVHHITLLVHTWLFVSVMYTKEDLYDDARSAVDEAQKLVELLKAEQAAIESSARAWNNRGWGLGKSISELQADIWAERARIHTLLSAPHAALDCYERGLGYDANHPATMTNVATILLDIFEEKIPAEPPSSKDLLAAISSNSSMNIDSFSLPPKPAISEPKSDSDAETLATHRRPKPKEASSAELNRIAARDRAYMLLSMLTKQGNGWDNAEAWFNLSRAHELMGQVDKAENCLWWVVQLEDARPIRKWNVAGMMQ